MKAALFFIALALFCFSAPGQTAPTESKTEKEKAQKELENRVLQMLDQAVGDAVSLKLARNRAVVYAIAGDLYWKFDEKRARELFRNCESEIIAANDEAEKDKKETDDPYASLLFEFSTIRNEILPSTRPANLAEAMLKAAQPNIKQDSGYMTFNPDQMRVQQEVALEQQFAVLAAEQSPDKAIKLLK